MAVFQRARLPIQKDRIADGDAVARSEQGLGDPPAIDEGAFRGITIHDAVTSGLGAKEAMLPGSRGILQSDLRSRRTAGANLVYTQRSAGSRERAFNDNELGFHKGQLRQCTRLVAMNAAVHAHEPSGSFPG